MKTPMSNYSGPVVVDPLTRIEGHLRIEVEVENGKGKDARSCGTLFRGLELILKGRDPRDVQHFTQRTCGVCTYTHALASTRALEDAVYNADNSFRIPDNATHIRNLVLAQLYMHDHIVHFYHLHALDFVDVVSALKADPYKAASIAESISPRKCRGEDLKAVQDKLKAFVESGQLGPFTNAYFLGGHDAYYLEPEANLVATAHYLQALELQVEAARGMAVFGGKNPHPQFLVHGGVTCYDALKEERIKEFEEIATKTAAFVKEVYIPDLLLVAGAYKDWAGIGGTHDFLSMGDLPAPGGERDLNSRWLKPGVIYNRELKLVDFDPAKVKEHIRHSWYDGTQADHPYEEKTEPKFTAMGDTDRYSWLKAPRYEDHPTEVGPLANVLVNYVAGNPDIVPLVDYVLKTLGVGPEALFSTLGRTGARGIQTLAVANKMPSMIEAFRESISRNQQIVADHDVPAESQGVGFVEAPRGGLSHWIRIEKGRVGNFQLVVPTTWNGGPRDAKHVMGPFEEALINTPIADPKRPVEILRTIHSFDPCIACAVHVIDGETNEVHKFKVL